MSTMLSGGKLFTLSLQLIYSWLSFSCRYGCCTIVDCGQRNLSATSNIGTSCRHWDYEARWATTSFAFYYMSSLSTTNKCRTHHHSAKQSRLDARRRCRSTLQIHSTIHSRHCRRRVANRTHFRVRCLLILLMTNGYWCFFWQSIKVQHRCGQRVSGYQNSSAIKVFPTDLPSFKNLSLILS